MKHLSVTDSVVISRVLHSEIRRYIKAYNSAVRLHLDANVYLDEIRDLIHAYDSINSVPFEDLADDDIIDALKKD